MTPEEIYASGYAGEISQSERHQLNKIKSICELIDCKDFSIVGSHVSTSRILPVTSIMIRPGTYAFIRDNFYDIKLSIISDTEIDLPLSLVHCEVDEEWLNKKKAGAKEYRSHPNMKPDTTNYDSDDWYEEYSGNTIIRLDGKIYIAQTVHEVYCEGINQLGLPYELFKPYMPKNKMFTVSITGYPKLAFILDQMRFVV